MWEGYVEGSFAAPNPQELLIQSLSPTIHSRFHPTVGPAKKDLRLGRSISTQTSW